MGIFHSKKPKRETKDTSLPQNQTQICDDAVVNRLRKDLNENPEMFLVNNIMMSIQFYENFEREMEDLQKNQVSEREMKLNKALAEYRKHCLLPDTVMENINERVRFRPFHGPKKIESQPLLHQRMFIVHDNIETLYERETADYCTVDGPIHRAVLELSENQGYVQLKQVEFLNVGKNEDGDSDTNNDADDVQEETFKEEVPKEEPPKEDVPKEKSVTFGTVQSSPPPTPGKQKLLSNNTSPTPIIKESQFVFSESVPNEPRRPSETKRSSLKNKLLRNHSFTLSSSAKPSTKMKESVSADNILKEVEVSSSKPKDSEDYGYTTLRRMTASKPLDEVRSHRNVSGITGIPLYCIKEIKVRKIMDNVESDSDDSFMEDGRRKPPKKKKIQDFYDVKKFFNSLAFVSHFCDVYETLYPILGFTKESFSNSMVQRGKIYSVGIDRRGNNIMYEVIPTVATAWPEIAFEWNIRKRAVVSDPTTKRIYQWPTDSMAKKIQSLQANVLPVGFVAKRGINKNQELEWSLSFPAAERYMQTCMSHSQVRCYLFILALYKTFMEPHNTKLGLAPHHILNIIFWECEKNYITWPEDRLGTKMIKILDLLYNYLAKGYLPDYFVRERNLFESLPGKYLRISQKKLYDIKERPAVHVMLAMRNLRYASGNFFPTLDFKHLYSILTETNSLALINPTLSILVDNNTVQQNEERNEFKENAVSFWNNAKKTEDRERQWKRNLRKQLDMQKKEKQENLNQKRRASVDSIDLQINVPKLDSYRKRCLLEFFLIHFIDVANRCLEYESYNYATVILEHTRSLATLLGEEPAGEVEARPYKRKVMELIDRCHREKQNAPIPDINRESRNFAGVKVFDHKNPDMTDLQKQFMNDSSKEEQVVLRKIPRKKHPGNLQILSDVDVHSADISSPAKSTPTSIQLDEIDSLNLSTDL